MVAWPEWMFGHAFSSFGGSKTQISINIKDTIMKILSLAIKHKKFKLFLEHINISSFKIYHDNNRR